MCPLGRNEVKLRKYYLKKHLSLLLSLILLFSLALPGCSKESEYNEEDLKSFSDEDLTVQRDFESFLKKIFTDTYASSTITINFLMEHPENYGITPIASRWPEINYENLTDYDLEVDSYMKRLDAFSYDSLTCEQKLIYDTLLIYLENESVYDEVYLFESPFSTNGIQSQLPLIFAEYQLNNKTDIEEYLNLLDTLDDYVEDALLFEEYRGTQGYHLSEYSYRTAIGQCETFLEQGDEYLLTIFQNKLNDMETLTEQEKLQYTAQNKSAVTDSVIPAYHNMIDRLSSLMDQDTCEVGLVNLEGGLDYYNYLLKRDVGTTKSPKKLINLVDSYIDSLQKQMTRLVIKNPSLYEQLENYEYVYSEPENILNHLAESISDDFPQPVSMEYSLKDIDDAMSDDLSIALYILSPVDNYNNNTIYLNRNRIGQDGSDLFPTLAHEGIPGHMYQHDYFCSTNPHYFRSILTFTGYSEAWAEYVETMSYDWSGLDESLAQLLAINQLYSDAIPTRIDLGVNYEGWTLEDTSEYLADLGLEDEAYARIYYDTAISSPTIFFPYFIGYLELIDIQDTAKDVWGDKYNAKDFHKYYLETGPAYFDTIRDRIADWTVKLNE